MTPLPILLGAVLTRFLMCCCAYCYDTTQLLSAKSCPALCFRSLALFSLSLSPKSTLLCSDSVKHITWVLSLGKKEKERERHPRYWSVIAYRRLLAAGISSRHQRRHFSLYPSRPKPTRSVPATEYTVGVQRSGKKRSCGSCLQKAHAPERLRVRAPSTQHGLRQTVSTVHIGSDVTRMNKKKQ